MELIAKGNCLRTYPTFIIPHQWGNLPTSNKQHTQHTQHIKHTQHTQHANHSQHTQHSKHTLHNEHTQRGSDDVFFRACPSKGTVFFYFPGKVHFFTLLEKIELVSKNAVFFSCAGKKKQPFEI